MGRTCSSSNRANYTKSELAYPCGNQCEHRTLLPVTVAGSTAIREHAVTAVGIRTNETLQHTFRTGRRAAATRATHGRAGEAPPTVCQQPARVVRDESWDESWAPYYNLYAGTPRDSSGTNGASGCQPRNQDTQVHILRSTST